MIRHTRIFLSHSHKDRELAGQIKADLERRFGLSVFVAHEDITPTEEWQERILEELHKCDAFMLLLTRDFEDSNWTDQETGIALALHKQIISIKVDTDPYGFIYRYQSLKWNKDDYGRSFDKLVAILFEKRLLSREILIERFAHSGSFNDAAYNSELLLNVEHFTKRQINKIAKAAAQNNQIYGSFKAQENLPKLFSMYRDNVDAALVKKFKELAR